MMHVPSNVLKLWLLYAIGEEAEAEERRVFANRNITSEGRRRRDRRYPRSCLRGYEDSPFKHLYNSGNDQGLLNATGVDQVEFHRLLSRFRPVFENYTFTEDNGLVKAKSTRGRPRSIDAIGCLGLVLMWYRTKGATNRSLPLVFGLTFSPLM